MQKLSGLLLQATEAEVPAAEVEAALDSADPRAALAGLLGVASRQKPRGKARRTRQSRTSLRLSEPNFHDAAAASFATQSDADAEDGGRARLSWEFRQSSDGRRHLAERQRALREYDWSKSTKPKPTPTGGGGGGPKLVRNAWDEEREIATARARHARHVVRQAARDSLHAALGPQQFSVTGELLRRSREDDPLFGALVKAGNARREGLMKLKLSVLQKRAEAGGLPEKKVAAAVDAAEPKAALVRLLMAAGHSSTGPAEAAAEVDRLSTADRSVLQQLKNAMKAGRTISIFGHSFEVSSVRQFFAAVDFDDSGGANPAVHPNLWHLWEAFWCASFGALV